MQTIQCAINPGLYSQVEELAKQFHTAMPFPHIVIDDFLTEPIARELFKDFPSISEMRRSNHYLFANKYELPEWQQISNSFSLFHQEITSDLFRQFINNVVGEDSLIDPEFCGDPQQGRDRGFLDMHVDFNLHPRNQTWHHHLNVLIYLNDSWQPQYGGDLELRLGLQGEISSISPAFNRCVIMLSDDTTYHGYKRLSLPDDMTRKAILVHGYKVETHQQLSRTLTSFAPYKNSVTKLGLVYLYNFVSSTKGRFFGSSLANKKEPFKPSDHP